VYIVTTPSEQSTADVVSTPAAKPRALFGIDRTAVNRVVFRRTAAGEPWAHARLYP